MSDTPTPRTDAAEYYTEGHMAHYAVSSDFARELERGLAAANADAADLASDLKALRSFIKDQLGLSALVTIGNASLAAHEARKEQA